jgi:ankyrin repeat protein
MTQERMISRATCGMAAIVCGLCVALLSANEPGMNSEAERHFENANELHKLADYEGALAEYRAVMSVAPGTAIAQNAHYWVGQIQYEQHDFDAALATYGEIIAKYPTSTVVPTTRVMLERAKQAKKNRALFEAVKKADVEQVRLLLAGGAAVDAKWGDVNTKEEEKRAGAYEAGDTPLCCAVNPSNMDVVKLLVEAGADVNGGRWPPLCRAVDENNTAIAEYLIDHGANVNVYPIDEGWGPLQETVVISNSVAMAKLLLARGADINSKGYPVLNSAVYEKRKDLCEFLIQRGANVNAKDMWGQTSLYLAIRNDDLDIVNILIANGADINAQNDRGQTALNAMLDVRSNSGYSGYRLSKDMVELLLAKAADVNFKDKDGRTPLQLAAGSADADIVRLLLDKGARVNDKDDASGFTPLHHAARFGNKDAAELLIARGAEINSKDKQGHTPLYVAVNHDYNVAELLMSKGADSSIRAESGRTLLELAQQRKQMESTVPDRIFEGEPNSVFGSHIVCGDVDGDGYDDILVGEYRYNRHRGRVYLFYGGPRMDTTADLVFEGQNEGDYFGNGIACGDIDNDGHADIVIAATRYSELRGRAYLYWGSDRDSMDAHPDQIFDGGAEKGAEFGACYPAVYDIDNDGYDDIILGACHSSNKAGWAGRAYLYFGNTKESMDTSCDLIFKPENPMYAFGYSISCGDVDNDGYGDIVIGGRERACLYYGGGKSNMDAKADLVFKAQSEGSDYFGEGVVCVDQNRDGYDDIIIGDQGYNDKQGRTYLLYGSSKRSMNADPDMIIDGEVEGSRYGFRGVCADIDGDKVNDLVVGAFLYRQRVGRVYVYWGKELAAPNPRPGMILTGENPSELFGIELACGDVNNDGFDDLVVGACGPGPIGRTGAKRGRAYLYYGGPRKR